MTDNPWASAFTVAFGGSAVATSSTPTLTKITINTVNTQRVGVAFTVTGTATFTGGNPLNTLQYADGSGSMKSVYVTAISATTYNYSFVHPAYTAVGNNQTLTVGVPGGVSAKSNTFKVVKA